MTLYRVAFFAVAVFLTILPDVVRAGVTFDFVNYPAFQNGYTLSGAITVDAAAVPASGVEVLHVADVVAYTVSVNGPMASFQLDQTNSTLFINDVQITSTQISLAPILSIPPGSIIAEAYFTLLAPEASLRYVADTYGPPLTPGYSITYEASGASEGTIWDQETGLQPVPPPPFVIAEIHQAVPEPTSLVIFTTLFAGFGFMAVRRRRQQQ